ncbi:MAG: aromatic amino acid lyase [Flavobacteriales bacterium]|nr:aromatic amino acid lyase [Flavobacteriales bacterium]MBT6744932.1 aromatic amino acid lyase [Flavobacteriales bacterium]
MIKIGANKLTLKDVEAILLDGEKVSVEGQALARVTESFEFLKEFSQDKVIYGINTGFGPMAQYRINRKHQEELQYNLIRSHCSGTGEAIPVLHVKALMIARLNTLMLGKSGVHPDLVLLLAEYINRDICPVIYEHGSVGASGDLVQLAHLALGLIGEGEVHYKGRVQPIEGVLKENGLTPFKVQGREGLAVMNGTAAMTGIGMVNLLKAKNLMNWTVTASAILNEIVETYHDHFSEELNGAKVHFGQQEVARMMRKVLEGSKLIKTRSEHLYEKTSDEPIFKEKVQEYYSLRCVPQIVGPVLDTIKYTEGIVLDEANSANDNPIIDVATKNVYHGGNFHGDYVALEMDKLKIAITKMSMLAERQLNYLMNHNINNKLRPFANMGRLGLNFGMQGVQFTATSTTAENQTLSNPMSIHSISCNNDNQDIVSMGTNAAQITARVIDNSFQVLAIELMTLIQAIDYLDFRDKMSPKSREVFDNLRIVVPPFKEDTTKYNEVRDMTNYVRQTRIII